MNWIAEDPTDDVEGIKLSMDIMVGLLEEHQGPINLIVDLSKGQRPNKVQRQIIINTLQSNHHNIKKVAIFGASPLMKAVSYFVINTAGFERIKFFDSRQQAIQWLHSENI